MKLRMDIPGEVLGQYGTGARVSMGGSGEE
jgi:hypothetical protein